MKVKHRKILAKLCDYTNLLGGELDGTSTNEQKYKDRQRANMLTYKVLYGILCDCKENEYRVEDMEQANIALEEMRLLTLKEYHDKNNYISPEELKWVNIKLQKSL